MPKDNLGYQPFRATDGGAALSEVDAADSALRLREPARQTEVLGQIETLAPADQVARDIAEIERATAALRRAEPALETWTAASDEELPAFTPHKPRPVWLVIGLLWLSTALVTAGAVVAIARFAG
jgi:hypothetical protein